jgi:hypothetical protein
MEICTWWNKLKNFTSYVKYPIPVELTLDSCPRFKKSEAEE